MGTVYKKCVQRDTVKTTFTRVKPCELLRELASTFSFNAVITQLSTSNTLFINQ